MARGSHHTKIKASVRSCDGRKAIPFRSVNNPQTVSYNPGFQRHHILPLQLLSRHCFGQMFDALGRPAVGFDDFRANGLLLPATHSQTLRTGLPLHRGPHKTYNELVIERVASIEASWLRSKQRDPVAAGETALMRLGFLQKALKRRLLRERRRFILNRKDPLGAGFDFQELDAMAEALWKAT